MVSNRVPVFAYTRPAAHLLGLVVKRPVLADRVPVRPPTGSELKNDWNCGCSSVRRATCSRSVRKRGSAGRHGRRRCRP